METKIEARKRFKGQYVYQGLLPLIGNEIARDGYLLDVGAGNGFLTKRINELFHARAIGIDLEPEDVSVLRADIANIPFKDAFFDTVICCDVVEHLSDKVLSRGLGEICRVLKDDGRAILSTLLEEDLSKSACKCPACGMVFHRVGHLQTFARKELSDKMISSGFAVKRIITTNLKLCSEAPLLMRMFAAARMGLVLNDWVRGILEKDIVLICTKRQ